MILGEGEGKSQRTESHIRWKELCTGILRQGELESSSVKVARAMTELNESYCECKTLRSLCTAALLHCISHMLT